ncbi:MAG TPA: GntR family transcriptional regulator [Thermomonospora sp.]|nr:GntR family transcriptional regulator [Thermomonospora sp.]
MAVARGSVVDEVADRIAFQIAAGMVEPGERLPSIRLLAAEHGINPSTVQLVLGRLRACGFVETRQGLGVVVRDIQVYGGIETWQYMFRFSRRLPDLTVRILRDVLDTLRLFYEDALKKVAADPRAYDLAPVRRALQRLELMTDDEVAAGDVHKCVMQILRSGRAMVGGGLTLGILNSLGDVLGEVPEVLQALYAEPREHVWWWRLILTAWEDADEEAGLRALDLLEPWHAEVERRLRALLAG